MAIERDFDDHRFRQTEFLLIEERDVAVDYKPCVSSRLAGSSTASWTADLVGQLSRGEARVLL